MKTINQKVIDAYIPHKTTLREVGRIIGIDHHRVKRILETEGVIIVKGKLRPFTDKHRENISKACKGRTVWNKGKKLAPNNPKKRKLATQNMASHLRFDVSAEWLSQFEDIEKLKHLNLSVAKRENRYNESTEWYKSYILKFYYDEQFNEIYKKWVLSNKDKWLRPTIDHINPKANGGNNEINNLQFLTWFENRAKNDMSQDEWNKVKTNIKDYLI